MKLFYILALLGICTQNINSRNSTPILYSNSGKPGSSKKPASEKQYTVELIDGNPTVIFKDR